MVPRDRNRLKVLSRGGVESPACLLLSGIKGCLFNPSDGVTVGLAAFAEGNWAEGGGEGFFKFWQSGHGPPPVGTYICLYKHTD